MFKGLLNRAMRRYEGADPVIRMKAKFFFLFYILILTVIPIAIAYSAWSQLHNPLLGNRLNLTVLIPEALVLLPLAAILILLLKGRFSLSAHLLLVLLFLAIWSIMVLDRSGELSRLDTIAYVLGVLTLIPLAVIRRKRAILLYGAANLLALFLFLLHARGQQNMSFHRTMEYFSDNAVAIIFITLTAFTTFLIHQRALDQVESELAERRRQERENERLQAQLLHAHKMESVGRLAGGIAHDFNNLLAAIMGNISLATSELASSEQPGPLLRLREAEKALEGARGLTRQLLTFAKGGRPVRNVVELGKLVTEAATFVTRGSNVRPVFSVAAELWPVDADGDQIVQVIHNLVINAVQATPGGGTVDISVVNTPIGTESAVPLPPGDYVRVTVADHGTGIPRENLPNLFVPYFTTKPEGTGLGLATSFSIVRQHDGLITVDTEGDEGSRFHVYLPAAARAPVCAPQAAWTPNRGEGLVLVVDDNDAVRSCAEAMLAHLGYHTITANSGEEALDIYRRALEEGTKIRAIIMDLTMPGGIDGNETFQRIRAIDPDATAIVSSGYSDSPIMADHLRHGYRGVLVKPYDLEALGEVLRGLLES